MGKNAKIDYVICERILTPTKTMKTETVKKMGGID